MTVSADVESVKVDVMPTPAAAAAPSDVRMDRDRPAADIADLKRQQAAAEPTTAVNSVSKPAPIEPSRTVMEGDIVKQSEEMHSEDMLNDGTTVKKKLTTIKHVQPVTTIVQEVDGTEEHFTVDKLLGTETDEEVLVLEPGVLQLTEDQLENETQVDENEDTLEDGTWVRRKATTVTVRYRKIPSVGPASQPDMKPLEDQSTALQSKPSIIPVKLTKLEPLSKDRTGAITTDAAEQKPVEEQKPLTDERDATKPRSGSPSLSVVRLTKLEPLSFERGNGGTVPDQRGPEVPEPAAEQPSFGVQPTGEDEIVPVPSSSQMRGRPAWLPTTTAPPQDDDLELRAADVDKTTIQAEPSVEQFAPAPTSNIKAADEQPITEILASIPGSVCHIALTS